MTGARAEQLLDEFLVDVTQVLGFRRVACLEYTKTMDEATAQLAFPVNVSARGTGLFNVMVGVRFAPLAKWLEHDSVMLSSIGQPIHLLRRDKSYTEWEFSQAADLKRLRRTLLADIKKYALPFIERYSRLAELRKMLESPEKEEWIAAGLSVDSRVTVLAALERV